MIKNLRFLWLLLLLISSTLSFAQTTFWSDNFEDTGSPTVGTRAFTAAVGNEFKCASGFFKRTDNSDITWLQSGVGAFTGFSGNKYFGAMDIDRGPACGANNTISPAQTITWSNINISGKTGLSFKGLFGANSTGTFQGKAFNDATNNFVMDYMFVEYRIDGGPWTKILGIYPKDGTTFNGSKMGQDTDGDLVGDGDDLDNVLSEISGTIGGSGNLLDLRFNIFLNNQIPGALAFDNFRLSETEVCVAPTITAQPADKSICNGSSTTFTANATGATTWKWQVNTGAGFTDIVNGAPYSGATTATLTVTGATATMSGYVYRAVAINGVATCYSNSATATLNVSNISLASGSQTNVACFNTNTGAAAVVPSGGIGAYTYSWTGNSSTSNIATGLAAGSYTVTVTDAIGCTAERTFVITQPTLLNGTASTTSVSCNSGSNGTATITPSGGTPGYTYLWSTGATTATITGRMAGTYSVTITDANACTKTITGITIGQPATALDATSSTTNVSCNGGSNGTATVTPSGGTPGYTYLWSTGATTATITGRMAGTYSVTITDANACTKTITGISIGQPATALDATISKTDVSCNGGGNGTATVVATGGTTPYTYSWSPSGGTNATATGLSANTYTVTIIDANSCQITRTITVNQPALLNATVSTTSVSCNGGSNGTATVTPSGGTPGYTYLWSTGATTPTITGLLAGSYSVTVTDANACTKTINNITVTQPVLLNATASTTSVSCNGGANGTATVTPTGGTPGYTYLWSTGATTATITGLVAGSYSVTITDANACTKTITGISIGQPATALSATISKTDVSCNGGGNGTATVVATGGTMPYTYSWSPSGGTNATATGLSANTYTVTVTDFNGCQLTRSITVDQPAAALNATITKTDVSCNGGANGTATVAPSGGTAAYTYLWSTGATTATITGLLVGSYSVTVTDANACTKTINNIIITQPVLLNATASTTSVSCNGGSNGTATVTPSGGTSGYTYLWNTGATTQTITGLAAGAYSVTITDANACAKIMSNITVSEPSALTATAAAQTNVSCNGGTNGSATVSVTGGTPGYTYAWAPSGGTAATASGLAAGTYTVTITDANACITTQSFTITQPNALALASASLTDGAVGAAYSRTFVATGGSGSFNYSSIGVLPAGVTLSAGGVLSGTPTAAGSYAFTIRATDQSICAQTADQAYTLTIGSGTQTITFAPLASRVYGDAAITLAATSSAGLPVSYASSNQNVATITGNTLTITGAGTTNITASQAGNGSYLAATDVVQSLTVTGKPITGTFTVSNKAYDGTTTANIQTRTLVGVAPADQANVSLTGGTATFASVDAGNGIIVSQTGMSLTGSKAGNYILQSVAPGTGTINPTPLTVTANALSKAYGDADPVLTYTTSGLIAGDALSGSLSRSAGDGVGSYAITASGLNAGGNYTLNFVGADFTINKRVLTITAENKSRSFNTANPTFTFSYAGFANGETSAVLTSPATASTTATISSPGGSYPIVPGGAAAANYSFNYVNGTLTVTANSQTITFAALADKLSTDPIFTLNATSSAGLTVSFSSSDASIARIVNGNQVEILKAGTVNITASQAGNASYAAATPVVQALKINDNPAPVIAISSSRGTSFNKGERTTLTATGATTYVWSNAVGIISGQNTDKLTVRPVANTVYTVTGSNQYGRTSTQTIAITLMENLDVVQVDEKAALLTPDGDGVNDYFVVKNLDLYPNNTVTIYDMTGKTLYKTKSYKNDWDGSINGNPIQMGTYFYIIEFGDGKRNAKKGYITVVK